MVNSIERILSRGPATSRQIQQQLGLSQAAVSRQLRAMGERVIVINSGRPPRYALVRNAFGSDGNLPLYMIDAHGNNVSVANIRPLAHGGYFISSLTGMPSVLLGVDRSGVYDDLPYFLEDLRPQGFLGRQIAAELSTRSNEFPADPRDWNANHVGRYLVSNGDDLPGNFQLGENAHLRIRRNPTVTTPRDYPVLAENVMNGVLPGSSAGGEQPKFTAYCGERRAHVIVKFSPNGDDPVARRWRDILLTEYHASEALHDVDAPAAELNIHEADGRLFLESARFDRSGEHGRMSMLSLKAIDAEFVGIGANWVSVMNALHEKQLVSLEHVFDAEVYWVFGRLINNTDMHLGNLSFYIEGNVFRLLPVYDMCSMGFAPRGGDVLPYRFTPPNISSLQCHLPDHLLASLLSVATHFWARIAADQRASDELRRLAETLRDESHAED